MSIPHDEDIQLDLLKLLNKAPSGTMHCNDVYGELAKLFPELTEDELNEPYENSASKWANRVQFARLHCVQAGHIYRPEMIVHKDGVTGQLPKRAGSTFELLLNIKSEMGIYGS